MASGIEHDQSTKFYSLPFGIAIGILFGFKNGILAGLAFAIGGLWLSPDLDTRSLPLKRWGILQIIWLPYRKFIPHRSFLSHGPIIGTSLRISYLIVTIALLKLLINAFGIELNFLSTEMVAKFLTRYSKETLFIFIGMEGSVWLHLIKDKVRSRTN
ncbi:MULTISPECIES: metal-binding protein [Prochlorococcus]|uniref:metal-binding protein n=1 Tax=Prochlorococcus TaxID=1218 RepID=UPI000533A7C0|nr:MULTISPECIES: metal-binding protein [Prochlorococcus]KGG13717.1 hypothetical protein EV05_0375 [Prochlorococcus sp. MIT 0601]